MSAPSTGHRYSCIVWMVASGRFEFTDQTASRIWLRKPSVPARSLRITNVTARMESSAPGPNRSAHHGGPIHDRGRLILDAVFADVLNYADHFPPADRNSRIRLPIAAAGSPHNSRARSSETIATGLTAVNIRPGKFAARNHASAGRVKEVGRNILKHPEWRDFAGTIRLVLRRRSRPNFPGSLPSACHS